MLWAGRGWRRSRGHQQLCSKPGLPWKKKNTTSAAASTLAIITVQVEDEHFLLSLLPTLRPLVIQKKAAVKLQIHGIIYEAEFHSKYNRPVYMLMHIIP